MINKNLVAFAKQSLREARTATKQSFTDPSMLEGGGAAAPTTDPMAGPMPPMPAMAPGDPAAMGGDPMAAGAAPAPPSDSVTRAEFDALASKIDQLSAAGGAAGGAGAGGAPKPKVDVPTELYQIKKMMVGLYEEMGKPVPASFLLGDPSQDPAIGQQEAQQDPLSSAKTQPDSSINAIEPIAPASPSLAAGQDKAGAEIGEYTNGQEVSSGVVGMRDKAASIRQLMQSRRDRQTANAN